MPRALSTTRLCLRPFRPQDAAAAYEVFEGHPEVWQYDPGYQRSPEQRAALIARYAEANDPQGLGMLAVTLAATDELIGYAGLQLYLLPAEPLATPEVELAYKLGRAWWGCGYASEASRALLEYSFKELRLARIVSTVLAENAPSLALMRRLGMSIEPAPPAWPRYLLGILVNPYITV